MTIDDPRFIRELIKVFTGYIFPMATIKRYWRINARPSVITILEDIADEWHPVMYITSGNRDAFLFRWVTLHPMFPRPTTKQRREKVVRDFLTRHDLKLKTRRMA